MAHLPTGSKQVPFPRTMIDSITPATNDPLRERVARALGAEDRWPVQRENFAQWVIEQDEQRSQRQPVGVH